MKLPIDQASLFSAFEQGAELTEDQSLALEQYLAENPNFEHELNDYLGELKQVLPEVELPSVTASEWQSCLGNILEQVNSPTPEADPQAAPQAAPKSGSTAGSGAPTAVGNTSGLALSLVFMLAFLFMVWNLDQASTITPVPGKNTDGAVNESPDKGARAGTKTDSAAPSQGSDPNLVIEDLEVADDYEQMVVLPDDKNAITIIWVEEVDDKQ